jgi:uncharacterized protein YkwD/LysM repeat protein
MFGILKKALRALFHNSQAQSGTAMTLATLLITLLTTLAVATPILAQDNPDSPTAASAGAVVQDINRMRALNGVPPLRLNPLLVQAAQSHVEDMAANNNYSHYGSDGSTVSMRVSRTGFQSRAGVSENWVAVSSDAGAITWWMNSYIHRTNLLNPKWTDVGVGARIDPRNGMHLFVAVFGTAADGGAVVAASAPIETASSPALNTPPGGMDYAIQPGDTLLGVAVRYGLDWKRVAAINGLSEDSLLQIGQVIRLPGASDPAPGIGGPATADIPANLATSDYMVRSGDTLVTIAARHQTDWRTLTALNGLSENSLLQIGQVLKVPADGRQTASVQSSIARTHTVQAGETVITIAGKYGLNWKDLLDFNGLSDNSLLQIGQTLRLP